ncbi:MFS transporter [Methanobrevibacter filiformis]|uniref:Multidrug resistance protein Stp n=1 Tax=Methanobrevibacter filiformis TaxID=55758 RepID=A0A166C6D5_9EURY|nr:MFS transporter [Methanobrevibacter filiformis]KZX11627.1 multidrug resistance protein Stp [Methanobrevibacter filiformis]
MENNKDDGIVRDSSKKYVLFIAAFSTFFSAFVITAITVALPSIAIQFHINAIFQNWIATIFLLTVAILSVPFGKICGKFGLKKFLFLGIGIIGIGSLGAALSPSPWYLLLFRAVQGIGSTMISVSTFAIVAQAVPPKERGKALGMNISSVYIGLTLGPVLGGVITNLLGWEWIFYLIIPFLILNLIIGYSKVPEEWVLSKGEPFDYIGTLLYGVGILLAIYGFTIINELHGVVLTAIGLIILVAFVLYELRQKIPVFEVKLFKNTKFSSSTAAALISYLATFVVTYILTYYLQYIKGMDPQTAGIFLIVTPGLMAIIAPISGRVSDKIDPQILSAIGMLFVGASLAILSFLSGDMPLELIVIAMVLEGIGLGLFTSPNTNAIMSSVPRKFTGIASATVSTARVIGQTLSLGMLTVILAFILGSVQIIPKYYPLLIQSLQTTCIISTVFCIIAVVLSVVGINSKNQLNTE